MDRKPLSLFTIWVLWAITLALVPLFVWISDLYRPAFIGHLGWSHWCVIGLALWSVAGGYSVRRKLMVRAAAEANNGLPGVANMSWSAAQVIGFGTAEAVVLWGVVATMVVGCPRWFAAFFYTAGIVLLASYRPKPRVTATP